MSMTTRQAGGGRALLRQVRKRWQLFLFLVLPVAYILIFVYQPMVGVVIAFKNFMPKRGIWGSEWVGLKHFKTFFESYYFERVVGNTLRLSLYSLAVSFPLTMVFALMLNVMVNPRYKKFVQTVIYMPHFISTVVLVGLMWQIFSPVSGLYGGFYRLFVADAYPPDFLSKSGPFVHLYVWSGIWQNLGWGTIIYLAALSSCDPELHEAAQIDGATRLKRVIHIDLPVILPTASILLILNSGSIMNVGFEKAFLMQNTGNLVASEVISTYVYRVGLASSTTQTSYAAAVGLFNNVINCVLLFVVNMASRKLSGGTAGLW